MADKPDQTNHESIERLINSFADHEPPFFSLGTPFLVDTETTQALVRMGAAAIPALTRALKADNAKIAAYAAYCLGQMGDSSVLVALEQAREKYLTKEPKREYDYGVISAANRAIESLLAS